MPESAQVSFVVVEVPTTERVFAAGTAQERVRVDYQLQWRVNGHAILLDVVRSSSLQEAADHFGRQLAGALARSGGL